MATPVVVTAHLSGGVSIDPYYGLMLDGILTAAVRQNLSEGVRGSAFDGGAQTSNPITYPLPLARCTHAGEGMWHWSAGGAWLTDDVPHVGSEVHWITSRFDVRRARDTVIRVPRSALGKRGRFRPTRRPILTLTTNTLHWRALTTDMGSLRALLSGVHNVGARRGVGEGAVLHWEVSPETNTHTTECGADGWFTWLHTTPHGDLSRPVPPACAEHAHAPHALGRAGIRPPYFHPSRQQQLALRPQ